jgi:hypothetical protein
MTSDYDNSFFCYSTEGNNFAASKADCTGGVKSSMSDPFQREFFLIDSGTRGDSAIPSEVVRRRKLKVHQDTRLDITRLRTHIC